MSAWIKMVSDNEADPELAKILDLARTPHGTVDNVMRVHSLRPNTMVGHVSTLNNCPYSYANLWKNAAHLIGDPARAAEVETALQARTPEAAFEGAELALLRYAEKLTLRPGDMDAADFEALKAAGVPDGEILEANQIIGYFNYVNRLLNGLGVTTDGDVVGYYKD